jgi:hypothetical protein
MTPSLLLRISSVISLIFALGHAAGGLKKWSPMGDNAVLRAMTNTRFETMGVSRSYLDFFMGFGWCVAAALLLQAVLLWQLAGIAQTLGGPVVRPMIAAFAVGALAFAVIAWRLIFPVPAIFSGVLFITLATSYVLAG